MLHAFTITASEDGAAAATAAAGGEQLTSGMLHKFTPCAALGNCGAGEDDWGTGDAQLTSAISSGGAPPRMQP